MTSETEKRIRRARAIAAALYELETYGVVPGHENSATTGYWAIDTLEVGA